MTSVDQLLSEFMEAWHAGDRPRVREYLARAPQDERDDLAEQLSSFLTVATTPAYDDAALAAIRAEPVVARAHAAQAERGALLPELLRSLRARSELSASALAERVGDALGLGDAAQRRKAAGYVDRLEDGSLEPGRVSRKVFDALGRVLGVPGAQLEGAADAGGWARGVAASPAPMFRADADAAAGIAEHLDVLGDLLATPDPGERDAVDELFLGGR